MKILRKMTSLLAAPLAAIMLMTSGIVPVAHAALVPTDQVMSRENISADRDRVNALMAREDMREQVKALGVDPNEAAARVAALSDREIADIAAKLDQDPAGQGALGVIIGAALIIFIVLLITDVTCLTSVFTFTRCQR